MPYRMLKRELPFVMVAHCAYPAVTGGKAPYQTQAQRSSRAFTPASLSRHWITEVLRRRIGYQGLIVSDDLEMGGVLAAAGIGEAAVGTIQAGADLFLVCHKEENVWRAYNMVLAEAERNQRFRLRVEEAAQRVLRFKAACRSLARPFAPVPEEADVAKLRREMWEFSEKLRFAAQDGAGSPPKSAGPPQRRKNRLSPENPAAPGGAEATAER
jgi:beta-N-acetylhexosaminidase